MLINKGVDPVHNLGNQLDHTVNGIVGGRSYIDHTNSTVLDNQKAHGFNLDTGGVAAAVGTLTVLALCSELDPAAAETDMRLLRDASAAKTAM